MMSVQVVLVLVLLISSVYGEFQIHFEKHQYTFPESVRVCVRVRTVGSPAPEHFSLSYTFDAALIGQRSGEVFRATQLFQQGAMMTRLCLPAEGGRDNQVCESDTVGTIRLINSSAIRLVEPFVASITVTDDEFVFASFSQPSYTFQEGTSTQDMTLTINSGLAKPIDFHLIPEPILDTTSPLTLLTSELNYEPTTDSAYITVALQDDAIALEEPELLSLGILLSSSQCYDLTITPTHITVLDNDVVSLRFTEEVLTVRESEGEGKLCVSKSHVIAKPLNFVIIHDSVTSGNQQKGGSIFGQFPALSNSSERCFSLPFVTDDIVGNDRHFTARLDVDESSYPTGVTLSNPTVTVHIQDTSICHEVNIDNSTDQVLEVPPHHTLCFQCQFKEDSAGNEDISWKIGGLVLGSGGGEVLSDGSLQVINSSSVFHESTVATLSCSSREKGEEFTLPVLLQGSKSPLPSTPGKSSSKSSADSLHSLSGLIIIALLWTLSLYNS